MARRYRSSAAQRKAVRKGRKEQAVPGTLDAFHPTARRNADLFGPGPGWYEPRPRPELPAPGHSDAARKGHRNAGRGHGTGGTKAGHAGKPGTAEARAAKRGTDPMADLLRENRLDEDELTAERITNAKRSARAKKDQSKLVTFTDEDGDRHQVDPSKAKPVNAPLGIDQGEEVEDPYGKGGRFHNHDKPGKPDDWHYDDEDPYPHGRPPNPIDMAEHIVKDVVINQAQKTAKENQHRPCGACNGSGATMVGMKIKTCSVCKGRGW